MENYSETSDIFVSYRRVDVEFTKQLVTALKAAGKTVWIDWEDIPPGSVGFSDDIKRGLEGADTFLCILSPNYLESTYCIDLELNYAIQLKKKLIPIVLEKFDDKPVPSGIGHINWIYFTPHAGQENTFEVSYPKVMQALDTDLDHVRKHKRIQLRAIQWNERERDKSYLLGGTELTDAENWISSIGDKKPEPTQLHTEYIIESRAEANARQRRLLMGVTGALVVTVILAIVSLGLFREASVQRDTARSERNRANDNAATAEYRRSEAESVALAANARLQAEVDQPLSVALALEAAHVTENPALLVQQVLATQAHQPGAVRRFTGHTDWTNAVTVSPDDQLVASAGQDSSLIVWDVNTGAQVHQLMGHEGTVNSVVFSPDGQQLLSGSDDTTVRLWDVNTGELLQTMLGHTNSVRQAVFTPDGKQALSVSFDGSLILWDLETGEIVHIFIKPTVETVAISPDGKTAVSGSCGRFGASDCEAGELTVWDLATGEVLNTWAGHSRWIKALAFSPDGKQILSGSWDNTLILWDAETGNQIRTFIGHTDYVTSVSFSPDGKHAVSGSWDNSVIIWNVETGNIETRLTGHELAVTGVVYAHDNQHVFSSSWDKSVILWDLEAGDRLLTVGSSDLTMFTSAFSPDGQQFLTGLKDGRVILWDAASGEQVRTFEGHTNWVYQVVFSPDGKTALSASQDESLILWDVATGEALKTLVGQQYIQALAMSPDGRYALASGQDDTTLPSGQDGDTDVIMWDLETGEIVHELHGHTNIVNTVAFSPDGKQALSGAWDNTLILWDLATGEAIKTLTGHQDGVLTVKFSPDGQQALSGSYDNIIILWDLATGTPIRTFTGHSNAVYSVAFSPDGQTAVSGALDTSIILWDIASAEPIRIYQGHQEVVNSVSFRPDGQAILSASEEGHAIIWRIETLPALVEWTCSHRLTDDFTPEESLTYGLSLHPCS